MCRDLPCPGHPGTLDTSLAPGIQEYLYVTESMYNLYMYALYTLPVVVDPYILHKFTFHLHV